jgi:hypothetical protein
MKKDFTFENFYTELRLFAEKSPLTGSLKKLLMSAEYALLVKREKTYKEIDRALTGNAVTAATDPWSEVEYQSLYLIDNDRDHRIVLQQPTVKDPMVGVMVLKAARLRGESGMVYCGTLEQLKLFAEKLPDYEKKGEDLNEKEFLECLVDAAESDGLKVIHHKLSEDHGGEDVTDE